MNGSGTADRVDRAAVSLGVSAAGRTHEVDPLTVTRRLQREGRWKNIEPIRDQMMRESKRAFPDKEARQAWVYSELDRMYPPVQKDSNDLRTYDANSNTYCKVGEDAKAGKSDDGQIQGLSDLPSDWPELPANASLAVEVGWVQANRLRIVSEKPSDASVVRLDLALSPAPSWAALGWLETSIRSYAKFVDVAAKVSGGAEDEGVVMKRERKSVDELRALLSEMEEAAGNCPSCGRPF